MTEPSHEERLDRIEGVLSTLVERYAGLDRILTLQIGEIDRRLEDLDHFQRQMIAEKSNYVSYGSFNPFKTFVLRTLATHRGRDTVIIAILSIGGALVVTILGHVWSWKWR